MAKKNMSTLEPLGSISETIFFKHEYLNEYKIIKYVQMSSQTGKICSDLKKKLSRFDQL